MIDSMENCRWQNYLIDLYILIYIEGAKSVEFIDFIFLATAFHVTSQDNC